MTREQAEAIVDAVCGVVGVDAGTMSEHIFDMAVYAVIDTDDTTCRFPHCSREQKQGWTTCPRHYTAGRAK